MCATILLLTSCTYVTQGPSPDENRGAIANSEDLFGDGATTIIYPEQNWERADSLWFYNTSQGSDLMSYDIFLHLETDTSTTNRVILFRSNENMRKYRFLPQGATYDNPDWLPVGWVKDTHEGQDYIGFTCAACHTTQVNYKGYGIRIDGGPSMADMQGMFFDLEKALKASLPGEKEENNEKFKRLATNVLKNSEDNNVDKLKDFQARLEKDYKKIKDLNHKDDPENGQKYGYGRLDAFGRIFNRIEDIRAPNSYGKRHITANAPVSYPFLWDTPQHDFVQWNGIVGNFRLLGLEPLGRNTSEVLGVFATIHSGTEDPGLVLTALGFGNSSSSARKWNQIALERKIKHLWSPSWEELSNRPEGPILPPIDWEKAGRGKKLYEKYQCDACHQTFKDRTDLDRRVIAQFSSLKEIGTDPTMAMNAYLSCIKSEFPKVEDFDWCNKDKPENPRKIAGKSALSFLTKEILLNGAIWDIPAYLTAIFSNPLISLNPFSQGKEFKRHLDFKKFDESDKDLSYLKAYKGRPLNGIWATAPYLHNGSIPNLYELFLPSDCRNGELIEGVSCRSKKFTVGIRELDTKKVGFVQRNSSEFPDLFIFDTTLPGNSNKGHEYAAGVTRMIKRNNNGTPIEKSGNSQNATIEEVFERVELSAMTEIERMELIEYLKTL
ncbi:MAG: hypothetical protein KC643_00635 [Nitrospira sp.]|nr:hypothetical protein [Nitrospira sp.]